MAAKALANKSSGIFKIKVTVLISVTKKGKLKCNVHFEKVVTTSCQNADKYRYLFYNGDIHSLLEIYVKFS